MRLQEFATDVPVHPRRMNGLAQLPEEVLWTMLGFLDVRGLCTARLVCKHFHRSASRHLKALQLVGTALGDAPSTNFSQFTGLTRLAVCVTTYWEPQYDLLMHPRIAPFVTDIDIYRAPHHRQPEDLAHVVLLPKLRALRLEAEMEDVQVLPVGLEELHFRSPFGEDVSPLTRFSRLTELEMTVRDSASGLGSLTGLCKLRCLRLTCPDHGGVTSLHRGLLSLLTRLTSLVLALAPYRTRELRRLTDLAHLTGLSHLELSRRDNEMTREDLACLSGLTNLTCLSLVGFVLGDSVAGSSALVPLTRLVSLGLSCPDRILSPPILNVEKLQSLTLCGGRQGVSLLQRATGLTHLNVSWHFANASEYPQELGRALAGMSALRSLDLWLGGKLLGECRPGPSPISQASTSLTRVRCCGQFGALRSDFEACMSLPCLRSLELAHARDITPACVPALQAMTGLTELALVFTGIREYHLTDEVRAVFNVERLRRGWPRLKITVQ